jgi:hypothetical protein
MPAKFISHRPFLSRRYRCYSDTFVKLATLLLSNLLLGGGSSGGTPPRRRWSHRHNSLPQLVTNQAELAPHSP